jgi:O-antigen/teichoic acid export membrane protein
LSANGRVFQSILALGAGQLLSWLGAIVLLILLPRYLGDVNLGKLTVALALTTLFGIFADLGTPTLLAREIAKDPGAVGSLTRAVLITRLPLGALAAALAVGFVWLAGYDELTKQIVYVLSAVTIVGAFANTLGSALQGLQRMRWLTASMVTGRLLQSAFVAALLLNGYGPLEVAAATFVATSVGLSVSAFALRRDFRAAQPIKAATVRALLTGGLPFFLWQAALVVYGQIDFVLLSILSGDAVVGWYAAAYRLIMLPVFTPIIVTTAVFPALSAVSKQPEEFAALARRSIQLIAFTTLPMALGILMLPDKLVDLLGYPIAFEHSIVPMMFLALHVPLAGIDMIIGTALGAIDRQRQWALTGVAAAVLNPVANLIAIPLTQHLYGNGAIGASIVTSATELFMLVVGIRLLPYGIVQRSSVGYVGRCIAAGLIMCLVLVVARELPIVLTIVVGALIYVAASLALRTLSLGEARQLVREISNRAMPKAIVSTEGVGGS